MKKIITYLVLLIGFSALAQWTANLSVNTLVANSPTQDIQSVGTSDGQTYVVYWKNVAAPQNYELRMQVLNAAGIPQFGPDGMLVSTLIGMSTYTVIWSVTVDANNNLYIGATGTQDGNAYVFKLDIQGNHLWGTNGVQVGTGNIVKVLPLSSGEAIVSWYPSGSSLMQKFDATGNAIWTAPVPVQLGTSNTIPAGMFELNNGDYMLVFHKTLAAIYSNLYAQRYSPAGVAQWATPTQITNKASQFNRNYTGKTDGESVYYGYFLSGSNRFDSYVQRINGDGTLPWGINGVDFDTNQTNYEMSTEINLNPAASVIWATCTYMNTSQSMSGEYIQKINKNTGARLFTDTAKEVYPISSDSDVHVGELHLASGTPFYLLKMGMDTGASPVTLHAVYLNDNGDFVWPEHHLPIANYGASKSRIGFTKPVNGQSVATFLEQKLNDASPQMYAQNFVIPSLGVQQPNQVLNLKVVNPVKNQLQISSDQVIQQLSVYNLLGVKIAETNPASLEINLESTSWQAGIYVVECTSTTGDKSRVKLIKE
ncbi:MAG: hypothetical protein RL699_189 [Bacteroidota bacterium]|jgi:hypothetical protein